MMRRFRSRDGCLGVICIHLANKYLNMRCFNEATGVGFVSESIYKLTRIYILYSMKRYFAQKFATIKISNQQFTNWYNI